MKNKFTLLLCFLLVGSLFAQERNCSTMENLEYRLSKNPNLARNMAQIETFTQNKVAEMENQRIDGNIITLPVVVHVLYRNSTENISVAQIESQLDVLNEDFRRTNPDADNVWSQAADTEIQFCLASVDPNGNSTTGITRKSTTRRNWGTSDDMKRASTGGIDPWNTSEYLNMWVVPQMLNAQGGTILGYAQFPGGSAATDGVVMGYNYFGRVGAVSAPFDGGRTTTHEVGHFLNLRHIWGDSNCGNDFVSDTPTHQTSNAGCPAGRVSCGSTDMYQNYMDYSNDVCMNLFTNGQKARMRAQLAPGGFRRSLALSDKCGGGTTQPSCTDGVQNGDETGVDCGGSCTPCQTGNQYCASQGNSVNDEYISRVQVGSINNTSGAQLYSDFTSISTNLNKGSNYTITVTPTWTGTVYNEGYAAWIDYNDDGDFSDSGEQIFSRAATNASSVNGSFTVPAGTANGEKRLRVSMKYNGTPTACETFPYGEVEDYTVNITTGSTPIGCSGAVTSFPYSEGFESGLGAWTQSTTDDINWTVDANGTPSSGTGPSSASQGSNYIFVEASGNGTGFPNKRAILNSPCFDLSSVSAANFNFKYHMYGANDMGSISLQVSTNNGSTWSTIWSQTGNKGNSWLDANVDLSAYVGGEIKLRFNRLTGSTWQADIAIDAINLSQGSADKCAGVPAYVSGQSYSPGDQVVYQNTLYERTSTGWINLGTCGTPRVSELRTVDYLDPKISIYPNPVSGNTLFVKSNIEDLPFTVLNMLGQQVAKGTSANGVNVSSLKSGLYMIQFTVNDNVETLKFIKK
ncbi:GEVED domain-containing protein [Winogradskyella litorisediminis]|uniref:GEVED domain-containing protein n=1 Tax=Winogradskyella litorisediminis TaxID=1156618 RepID=A0ABW3N4B4_9FLAO